MDLSRRNGGASQGESGRERSRRRSRTKLSPACEALDSRRLLLTMPTVALSIPPATAVTNAAADLNALQPTDFARFENDLAKAESHSRVNAAEINALAQDEVALNQVIQSAGLHPNTSLGSLNLQDVVVDALKDTPSEAASKRAPWMNTSPACRAGPSSSIRRSRRCRWSPGRPGSHRNSTPPCQGTGLSSRPPSGRSRIPISAPARPIAIRWKSTSTARPSNS